MKQVFGRVTVHLLLVSMLMSLVTGIGPAVSASTGLQVTPTNNKQDLVDMILGEGMTATEIRIQGAASAFGIFSGGTDIIGFEQGIILSTGTAVGVIGPNKGDLNDKNQSTQHNLPGDSQLQQLAGPKQKTYDAAILEIDFIPEAEYISFQYVFSSEEYHEYANSTMGNDVFALFVNGVNQSLIPGTNDPVSINTINGGNPKGNANERIAKNPAYFINNDLKSNATGNGAKLNLEMDGLTVVMSLSAKVNPGVTNTLKIAIADSHDDKYDSNVFIKAYSIKNRAVKAGEVAIESREALEITIDRKDGSDGVASVKWTAKDDQGVEVASGVVVFKDEETSQTFTVPGSTHAVELSDPIGGVAIETGSTSQLLSDIFDVNQTLAPDALNIEADGTAARVTVDQVPAGATVIIYNAAGEEIGRKTNTNATVSSVTIEQVNKLAIDEAIGVTLTESGKSESPATGAIPVFVQSAAPSSLSSANATTSKVTIPDVPAGAIVAIYDAVSGDLLTSVPNNSGATAVLSIPIAGGLKDQQEVEVTLTEQRKRTSSQTTLTAVQDVSAAPTSVGSSANATTNRVTIPNVPAGATVTVYDSVYQNVIIGSAINSGSTADQVVVTIQGQNGLSHQQVVHVTITELRKYESSPTALTAILDVSEMPLVSNIGADGTAASITISDVPPGVIVTIYNAAGVEMVSGSHEGITNGNVHFEPVNALAIDEVIYVTFTEPKKSESGAIAVTPIFLQSATPKTVGSWANATTDQVTIPSVPFGATVTVYDAVYNHVLGTVTHTEGTVEPVVVAITGGLDSDQAIKVTITELRKRESLPLALTAVLDVSTAPASQAIQADGTTASVVVDQVAAGATVILYDAAGAEIGRGTNTGTDRSSVTIEQVNQLAFDEEITVTITELDMTESPATTAMPVFAVSKEPSEVLSSANATTDEVIVPDVPAGAIVTVYDAIGGHVLGTVTNTTGASSTVTVAVAGGMADQQTVQVTITELRKRESSHTALTAVYNVTPWQPKEADIIANATENTVKIQDVPAGITVIIRDLQGNKLGEATNTGTQTSEISVSPLHPALVYGEQIKVSYITEHHAAGTAIVVQVTKRSEPLVTRDISFDVWAGQATIDHVPAGAEIIIYDKGTIIGRNTNTSAHTDQVVFTRLPTYQDGDRLTFSITLPGQLESEAVEVVLALTDDQAVSEAARLLKIGYAAGDTWESVTSDIFLLTVGAYDTQVSWTSNKPGSVRVPQSTSHTISADVVRQATEESVILTAKIEKNGVSKVRTFLVIVKPMGQTKEEVSNTRIVRVINQDADHVLVPVSRIFVRNLAGKVTSKIDKVVLTPDKAQEAVSRTGAQGNVSTIMIDNPPGDEADEFAVEIPTSALTLLADRWFDLNIQTDYATLSLSKETIRQMNGNYLDLFFRLVPVKQAELKDDIMKRLPESVEGMTTAMVGNPLTIETNYRNFATTLFIPFASNQIDPEAVQLDHLRIYIEHSDGENVVREGTLVRDAQGNPIGLSIEISKFSTFTIIELKPATTSGPVVIPVIGNSDNKPQDKESEKEIPEQEPVVTKHHTAYISGYPDATFRPDQPITRAEVTALLARNLEQVTTEKAASQQRFSDVDAGYWAASGIEMAYTLGLITGYPDGKFRPREQITRAEFAVIAANFKQLVIASEWTDSVHFADVSSHWATSAIDALKAEGVINGYPNGTFQPGNSLTRAEAITAINRLFMRGPLHGVSTLHWSDVNSSHWAFDEIAEASLDHDYELRTEGGEQWME